MKYQIPICFLLTFALQSAASAAGMKIVDQGMDGNIRAYKVYCENGTRGDVTQEFKIDEGGTVIKSMGPGGKIVEGSKAVPAKLTRTCVNTGKSKVECRASWSIDDAAETLCQ